MASTSISKRIFQIFLVVLLLSALFVAYHHEKAHRFYKVVTLFNADNIVENFRSMGDIFPYHVVAKGPENFKFEIKPQKLIADFEHHGKNYNVENMLAETDTTGFLVIKDDTIVFEKYYLGNSIDTLNISWSVNKSFVSALIGIALEQKLIDSIQDPIDKYLPELKDTGYQGVSIKNILQMSSGVIFDEDYAAFFSDINRMGRVVALGNSINEFAASLKSGRPAGEYHHYVSMDTQVLGMLLKKVTQMTPSEYLHQKIWSKLGMRSDAKWLIDDVGMELAFGTMNVTLRDYARMGLLYLHNGIWEAEQIVPQQWVVDSTTPDAAHLQPGENPASSNRSGYGYQWWIPEHPQDDFLARGVYGQYIYVSRKYNVVIVKTSADPNWRSNDEANYAMVAMLQNIAAGLK
jgi:hypothetical protein